jgi:hypothetical protein
MSAKFRKATRTKIILEIKRRIIHSRYGYEQRSLMIMSAGDFASTLFVIQLFSLAIIYSVVYITLISDYVIKLAII